MGQNAVGTMGDEHGNRQKRERGEGMLRNRFGLGCTLRTPEGGGGRKLRIRSLLAKTKVKIHLRSEVAASVKYIFLSLGHNLTP